MVVCPLRKYVTRTKNLLLVLFFKCIIEFSNRQPKPFLFSICLSHKKALTLHFQNLTPRWRRPARWTNLCRSERHTCTPRWSVCLSVGSPSKIWRPFHASPLSLCIMHDPRSPRTPPMHASPQIETRTRKVCQVYVGPTFFQQRQRFALNFN